MTRSLIPIRLVPAAVLAAAMFTATSSLGQTANSTESAKAAPQGGVLSCGDTLSDSSAGQAHAPANSHPHSVTLTWNVAVPVSNAPRDAIKGYYIYRSLMSHSYAESDRMNQSPLRATRCVDITVEPRKTYFYVVKSVTEGGKQSSVSAEIKAVVPFP